MTQDEIWTDEIILYPNSVIHPPLWCTTLNWPVGMMDSYVRLKLGDFWEKLNILYHSRDLSY